MPKTKKINYIYAVGRRREATCRVRLFKGHGQNMVNGILSEDYFPTGIQKALFNKPFSITGTQDKYFITVKVAGGGKNGQLEAVMLGIARALVKAKPDFRPALKSAGLLTSDDRTRERRKVGMGGKSRRKKQSPKR